MAFDYEDGGLYEGLTEVGALDEPSPRRCQGKDCIAPATHYIRQYNPYSLEDLVDGVDLVMCEPHARDMAALIS
jgi:hypothetical protein